jgi:hypothetical protein
LLLHSILVFLSLLNGLFNWEIICGSDPHLFRLKGILYRES